MLVGALFASVSVWALFFYKFDTEPIVINQNEEQSLGDALVGPNFFRLSSASLTITNTARDFHIGTGTASSSAGTEFGVDVGNQWINFNAQNYRFPSSAGSSGQILSTNGGSPFQTLSWAADATGGGGSGTFEVRENSATTTTFQDISVASLSFNDGAFNITASGTTDVIVKLDYTNGPASRSTSNTWTGLNIFSGGASVTTNFEVNGLVSTSNAFRSNRVNGADLFFEGWRKGEANARTYFDGFGSLFFGGSGTATAPHKLSKDSATAAYLNYTNTTASASIFIIDQADTAKTNAESTITLRRTLTPGSEFMDIFNNGYYTNGDVLYGQLIQKTGTADYHPWLFGYYDAADTDPNNQIKDAEVFLIASPSFPSGPESERYRGELGIRTASPSAFLTIAGGIGGTTASSSQFKLLPSTALLTNPEAGTLQYINSRFHITGTDELSVNGNVGIGKVTPATKLDVTGNASVSGAFEVGTYASATTFYANEKGINVPAYSFGNDTNTGLIRVSADSVGLVAGGNVIAFDATAFRPQTNNGRDLGTTSLIWRKLFVTNSEIQGTASASYLLTSNILQAGGPTSAAYNRFGTAATSHANYINTTNDVIVSGDLEVNATAAFDSFVIMAGIKAGAAGDTDLCLDANTNELTDAAASTCIVSSKRFKKNIKPLDTGLKEVLKLKPTTFSYLNDTKNTIHLGLIAEDVLEIEPRLVFFEPDGKTPRGIEFELLTALLVKSDQDLNAKIMKLEKKVADLEMRLAKLEGKPLGGPPFPSDDAPEMDSASSPQASWFVRLIDYLMSWFK